MTALVSVIIPTYNRVHDLARALASLQAQTRTRWEAIVVDNRSSDGTAEMVRRLGDPRIRLFEISNQGVIAASRNLGLAKADGEFVAFLDSDDVWYRSKLERAVMSLEKGADVVYHDMAIQAANPFYLGVRTFRTRQPHDPVYQDLLLWGNTLPTSSVVLRRALLEKTKGFSEDPELITGEDFDLWLRTAQVSDRFTRLDGMLGKLGRGGDNESGAARRLAVLDYLQKWHFSNLTEDQRREAGGRWLNYLRGRALYQLGNYPAARPLLVDVARRCPHVASRLKALYMLAGMAAGRRSPGAAEHAS